MLPLKVYGWLSGLIATAGVADAALLAGPGLPGLAVGAAGLTTVGLVSRGRRLKAAAAQEEQDRVLAARAQTGHDAYMAGDFRIDPLLDAQNALLDAMTKTEVTLKPESWRALSQMLGSPHAQVSELKRITDALNGIEPPPKPVKAVLVDSPDVDALEDAQTMQDLRERGVNVRRFNVGGTAPQEFAPATRFDLDAPVFTSLIDELTADHVRAALRGGLNDFDTSVATMMRTVQEAIFAHTFTPPPVVTAKPVPKPTSRVVPDPDKPGSLMFADADAWFGDDEYESVQSAEGSVVRVDPVRPRTVAEELREQQRALIRRPLC